MSAQRTRVVVRYTGNVQGVGFRMTVISLTGGMTFHGFVRNEPDGSVVMDVEGVMWDIQELMRRIESEMGHHIEGIEVDEKPPSGREDGFRIVR